MRPPRRFGPTPGRIKANSSPPLRKARSPGRIVCRMSSATSARRPVAGDLAEPAVPRLEVVDVEHAHREPVPAAVCPGDLERQRLVAAATVAEAGQPVVLLRPPAGVAGPAFSIAGAGVPGDRLEQLKVGSRHGWLLGRGRTRSGTRGARSGVSSGTATAERIAPARARPSRVVVREPDGPDTATVRADRRSPRSGGSRGRRRRRAERRPPRR